MKFLSSAISSLVLLSVFSTPSDALRPNPTTPGGFSFGTVGSHTPIQGTVTAFMFGKNSGNGNSQLGLAKHRDWESDLMDMPVSRQFSAAETEDLKRWLNSHMGLSGPQTEAFFKVQVQLDPNSRKFHEVAARLAAVRDSDDIEDLQQEISAGIRGDSRSSSPGFRSFKKSQASKLLANSQYIVKEIPQPVGESREMALEFDAAKEDLVALIQSLKDESDHATPDEAFSAIADKFGAKIAWQYHLCSFAMAADIYPALQKYLNEAMEHVNKDEPKLLEIVNLLNQVVADSDPELLNLHFDFDVMDHVLDIYNFDESSQAAALIHLFVRTLGVPAATKVMDLNCLKRKTPLSFVDGSTDLVTDSILYCSLVKVIKDQDTEDGDHGLIDRVLEAGAVSEVARAYEIIRKSDDDYQDELLSAKKLLSELLQH